MIGDGIFGGWCAATLHGPACGEALVFGHDEVVLDIVTSAGDSGAGVYNRFGQLMGVVVAGSEHHTKVALIDESWLP